jgi:alpha-beta hydrolase superfamily lysophospholipase
MNFKFLFIAASILLYAVHSGSAETRDSFWTPVEWTTRDGARLVGECHLAADPNALTWVLLHGLGSNKEEWESFGKALAAQGQGLLIYDLRGHGGSIHTKDGGVLNYREWTSAGPQSPWNKMADDLESAVEILQNKFHRRPGRIAVGGASVGANIAMSYAGTHQNVPDVLLLSPGMEYAGIQTEKVFAAYTPRPALLAASPGDSYAFMSVQRLAKSRGDAALRLLQGPNAEHGVNMFKDAGFTRDVLDWMKAAGGSKS